MGHLKEQKGTKWARKIIMWKFTNIYIGHLQKENGVMSLLVLLIVKLTTYKAGIMGNIENDKTHSLSLKALQSYWKRDTERQVLKYTTEAGEAEARGLRVPGQPGLHPASEKKLCFGSSKSQMSKASCAAEHAEKGVITAR